MQKPEQKPLWTNNISRPVILLGASNLTRGLSIVFETARLSLGSSVHVIAALGHGRSYGAPSRVILRSLPGILQSGLWSALEQTCRNNRNPITPVALITDIGNDIIYGSSPAQILDWINTVVDRLRTRGADIAVTTLPIASLQRVPRWQARLVKMVTYPGKGPALDQALTRAVEVDQRVRALAAERDLHLIEQQADWYGFDPIHIRKRDWPRAAAAMLAPLRPQQRAMNINRRLARGSLARWLRLRTALPLEFRLAGLALGRPQPARRFPDNSVLSLY